jgi:hypothetical protein
VKLRYQDFAGLVHPTLGEFHQAPSKVAS